jgi:hypothetical protein
MTMIDKAQRNFLLASAFWGLFLGILTWSSQWFLSGRAEIRIVWYVGNLLSVLFYPCLAAYLLYKRTCLWVNALLFSGAGTILSIMALYSIRAIPVKSWIGVGIGLLGILMVVQLLLPRMVQVPLVGKEKESPSWEGLAQASWVDFVLFEFLRDA